MSKVTTLPQPKFLWFLILSYCMVMVLANWFDVRLIRIFGLNTDAGTLIFPLTFLLSDLITEVYGYQQARRAIWCGFFFNVLFIAYGQLITHLPSPDYAAITNEQFDRMLSMNLRIILASMFSYLVSEPLNTVIMAKLKIRYSGRLLPLRFITSTWIASGMDSFIFGVIAFAGTMSQHELILLMVTMWFLKVLIEVTGLPVSIYCAHRLKQEEGLDVYDNRVSFNLFSLRVNYTNHDNAYVKTLNR